jgi:hypothetical protein
MPTATITDPWPWSVTKASRQPEYNDHNKPLISHTITTSLPGRYASPAR